MLTWDRNRSREHTECCRLSVGCQFLFNLSITQEGSALPEPHLYGNLVLWLRYWTRLVGPQMCLLGPSGCDSTTGTRATAPGRSQAVPLLWDPACSSQLGHSWDLWHFLVAGDILGWSLCWTLLLEKRLYLRNPGLSSGVRSWRGVCGRTWCCVHESTHTSITFWCAVWEKRMDGGSAVCRRMQVGQASPALTDGSIDRGEGLFVSNNGLGWRTCWECINMKWYSNFQLGTELVWWQGTLWHLGCCCVLWVWAVSPSGPCARDRGAGRCGCGDFQEHCMAPRDSRLPSPLQGCWALSGMLTLALGAHTASCVWWVSGEFRTFWTLKLSCVVITTWQLSVLPVWLNYCRNLPPVLRLVLHFVTMGECCEVQCDTERRLDPAVVGVYWCVTQEWVI